MKYWAHKVAVVLSVLMLLLAGCGGTKEPSSQQPSGSGASNSSGSNATPGSTPAKNTPKTGGTLKISLRTSLTNLDPIKDTSSTLGAFLGNAVETLVTTDIDGVTFRPLLATGWRSIDATTWEFKLRKDVKFHDGTPFNAAAAKFSLERMASEGSVHKADWKWLKEVKVIDDHTIHILTDGPYPAILSRMAYYIPYIVSPDAVKKMGDSFTTAPVGTGPFKIQEHVQKQKSVMVRNDDYWGEKAYLDKLEWIIVPEENARLAGILSGDLNFLTVVEPTIQKTAESNPDLKVHAGPGVLVDRVGFNTQKKPFDDKRVRQAVVHALNREEILKTVFGGQGILHNMPFAPGIWGFDAATMKALAQPYDVAKAKQLLAEAGYPNGFEVSFTHINRPDHRQIFEVLQAQLKEVGITLKPVALDFAAVSAATRQGDHEMYIIGSYGLGDPDRVLPEYETANFNSKNRNFYSNPDLDKLISAQRVEMDTEKRKELLKQIAAVIQEEVPDFSLRVRMDVQVAHKSVKGYVSHPEKWTFQTVWLDQ